MGKFALTLLICALSSLVYAQDTHYWTEQFGNRSMLLSGAVIGSVEDLGAVFYNPARVALQDDPAFLISAKAYQLVTLGVKDGFGETDLNNDDFGPAPSLAAGTFDLTGVKWLKPFHTHKFAYAFLSRYNFNYSLNTSSSLNYEYNPDWPGPEDIDASFAWNKTVKEEWMGVTWAIPLNNSFSIGISNFMTTISQSANFNQEFQGVGSDGSVAIFNRIRNRKISSTGYVGKLGVNYESPIVSVGLTMTSPTLKLRSSGSARYEEVVAGYENSIPGTPNDVYVSNSTSDVEAQLKSPFSVGLGTGLNFNILKIHLSAEWFNKVDEYFVLVPEPFTGQTSGQLIRNRYVDERNSVINYGFGMEWKLTDSLQFYTSFSTDNSSMASQQRNYIENTDLFSNTLFSADIYNFGAGFSFELRKMELTLGGVYSRGVQSIQQFIRFPQDQNSSPQDNELQVTDLLWQRWRILVGFSLPFYKFG